MDGVLAAVGGVIATFYLAADDPGSPLRTPANLGGFLLSMPFILLLSIFMGAERPFRPSSAG